MQISIHAPLAGGDFLDRYLVSIDSAFQSTPPSRGATPYGNIRVVSVEISIHAPLAGGDDGVVRVVADRHGISIHAPLAGGDLPRLGVGHTIGNFNPRPPRGGRQIGVDSSRLTVPISIHAPLAGGDGPAW